jgi:YesN/AraC family two-component response regulator
VLVADDQALIREGIASLLGIEPGIEVVGTAADGSDAVAKALALTPDVVLMDVRMPGVDGVQAVALLRQRLPACRVLMLTTFDDQEYVIRALRAAISWSSRQSRITTNWTGACARGNSAWSWRSRPALVATWSAA